jgi:hypothetical protein
MEAQTRDHAALARAASPAKHQHPKKLQKTRSWDRVIVYDADSGDVDIRKKGEVDRGTTRIQKSRTTLMKWDRIERL